MQWERSPFLSCILLVILTLVLFVPATARAATSSSFVSADASVQTAFLAVHSAEARGGNVSGLDAQLNTAIGLIQSANSENSTNPAQATRDLQNATNIAQSVEAEAPTIGQQGASARQLQLEVSIGLAAVMVAVAAALYVMGDRISRRLWLRMYGGYVVRKVG